MTDRSFNKSALLSLPLDFSQLKIMKHYCQVILNGDCFAPKSGRAGT